MNKERALVVLVALDVFLVFASMGVDAFFSWTLPGELRDHHGVGAFGLRTLGMLSLWGITAACAITAWVGLINHWWFARRLYVVACVATLVLTLGAGPAVSTPLGAVLDRLDWLVGGAIFGLIYFTDLSRHFERRPQQVTNGAHARA